MQGIIYGEIFHCQKGYQEKCAQDGKEFKHQAVPIRIKQDGFKKLHEPISPICPSDQTHQLQKLAQCIVNIITSEYQSYPLRHLYSMCGYNFHAYMNKQINNRSQTPHGKYFGRNYSITTNLKHTGIIIKEVLEFWELYMSRVELRLRRFERGRNLNTCR